MGAFNQKSKSNPSGPSAFNSRQGEDFFGVQTKLSIGKSNDKYEVEADKAADQIVSQKQNAKSESFFSPSPVVQKKSLAERSTPVTQLKTEQEETLQNKTETVVAETPKAVEKNPISKPLIQQKKTEEEVQTKEEEQEIQKSAETETSPTNTASLESKLQSSKGGGSPMANATQNQMESGFGANFSKVRIHNDSNAVQMNKELGSQAFANGNDVYFNEGKYNPDSQDGKHLLAHELTHTIQQGNKPNIQKQDTPSNLDSLNEMLDSFNVPEDEVILMCAQLNDTEKATVLGNSSYKTRMAAALDVAEMIRAVNNLGAPLNTKLEWVNAAATFGTFFMAYSEIKGMVTAADQPQRDVLKTDVWKSFFVGVCTNANMIEALDDLQFDLVTKLVWLNAEIYSASWSISYSEIKPWITSTTTNQTERDALKVHSEVGMNFFVGVCDNITMIEALNDLQFDLATKLTWLNAEMFATRFELDYATIKPWIINSSTDQAQKDALKTPLWRDFFSAVCDNTTMVEAVTDLNFDIVTQLDWINFEGSDFIPKLTWLLNHSTDYDVIRNEILSASPSDRQAALADTSIRSLINSKLTAPVSVAVFSHLLLGSMYWRNPQNNDFFAYFVTNGGSGTLPAAATMNCWESIMYAAYLSNKINASWIQNFYNTAFGASDPNVLIWSQLGWNSGLPVYPGTTPTVGQLIFYTESGRPYPGHVAMAIDGTHAISLWSQPNNDFFIQRVNINVFPGVIQISNPPW
ncbi:DUF4157 domain-containing protein [Flavobacterium tructae]|uniref:eCIS core domain-containing protein n=1 Tax=Flavobacterium tructae TaxID=1114873 RepID=UPI002552067A|nr:DUF4157 domain-containing protein [Flavobacterium tructae]MDL2144857.1 DUF4157 domain-containing protein [Flavobacterium tructae]